jgi:hypothetical protein
MAREALEHWAEGMRQEGLAIPETRDFEALRADREWTESFRDAVFVIAVEPPWRHETCGRAIKFKRRPALL